MSKHQKRLSVPKSWPVARKEQQYTVKASAGPHGEAGVPLLILLRDVLGYADSKRKHAMPFHREACRSTVNHRRTRVARLECSTSSRSPSAMSITASSLTKGDDSR